MKEFVDATGMVWVVALDGLTLAELREKSVVDLVQDGMYPLEEREDVLIKALLILCRDQREERKISEKHFAKAVVGEVHAKAIEAVRGAAELFFRPSRWSEIQSRSQTQKEMDAQYQALRPMLAMLNRPDMPAAMREAVMTVISQKIEAATSSQQPSESPSASGQDVNLPNAAGDSQASLESILKA